MVFGSISDCFVVEKTAQKLIMKEDLLERLVNFCLNSDHPGVRAESPRLLSWLIKHSHSSESYTYVIKVKDCVKCLVEMIPSSHGVMQNEALFALNLLCAFENISKANKIADIKVTEKLENEVGGDEKEAKCSDKNGLQQVFVEADIGKYVAFLLNKYSDKMEKEIIENLLLFLEKLCEYPDVKENLKTNKMTLVLKKILERKELAFVFDRVNKISGLVEPESDLTVDKH